MFISCNYDSTIVLIYYPYNSIILLLVYTGATVKVAQKSEKKLFKFRKKQCWGWRCAATDRKGSWNWKRHR